MAERLAVVKNRIVTNIIVGDGSSTSPEGSILVQSDTAQIGWIYDGKDFNEIKPQPTKQELVVYANVKQVTVSGGGITVNSNASGPPVMVQCATDIASQVNLLGAYLLAKIDPKFTTEWVTGSDSISLTADQIMTIAPLVAGFVNNTFAALATVLTGITTGGIVTIEEIENFSWPKNS